MSPDGGGFIKKLPGLGGAAEIDQHQGLVFDHLPEVAGTGPVAAAIGDGLLNVGERQLRLAEGVKAMPY